MSELYIEDEDHEKLRESVDDYDNFDQVCVSLVTSGKTIGEEIDCYGCICTVVGV